MSVALTGTPASAQKPSPSETAVKATFIVKFISYLNWPESKLPPGAPIMVCVVGRDPFGNILDRAAAGQHSAGHPIVVRRFALATQAGPCHLAYLGGSNADVSLSLSNLDSRPVVTVTDARASNASGIIHFQMMAARVRFDIDARAAARSRIDISSKLLALARNVRGEQPK